MEILSELTMQDIHERHRKQWREIELKAQDIFQSGLVTFTGATPKGVRDYDKITGIEANVEGEEHTYKTALAFSAPGSKKLAGWHCSCPWGHFAFERSPHDTKRDPIYNWSSRLQARMCSHALALYYYYESGKLKNVWEGWRPKRRNKVAGDEKIEHFSDVELFHHVQNEHQKYQVEGARARNIDKLIESKAINYDKLTPEELRRYLENLFV